MEDLIKAIHKTPIIDNHAHPLLIPSAAAKYPLLAITTEAHGDAMKATTSSLSHIRAVNQLSSILGCPATWHDVQNAIEVEKAKPDDVWAKRCLEGIETILVDDGLDGQDEVFDYAWHDRLTRSKCTRIVRIEKVAEEIIDRGLKQKNLSPNDRFVSFTQAFKKAIEAASADPEVVGFKSVICYRTGLSIGPQPFLLDEVKRSFMDVLAEHDIASGERFTRLDGGLLNSYIVHCTAEIIRSSTSKHKKPFQFHTGLGDNDITLTKSSPSHLQDFIRAYPQVPIVLLHASYPWTKEAGYLASVYENVYADIGEIFPFISRDGQEKCVREILEICPSEKILWSTDGHWFPETYLLAVIQVREALEAVLTEYVRKKDLTVPQAVKVVQDLFFKTSNTLYDLNIPLQPLTTVVPAVQPSDLSLLEAFLDEHPSTKFLRLQYLDYTATPRMRIVPIKRALSVLQTQKSLAIGITKASLGLLQNDVIIPEVTATGEYKLEAVFSSIKPGPSQYYASVQAEFHEDAQNEAALCPRSILRRTIEKCKAKDLEFLLGFEIEIVFMSRSSSTSSDFTASGYSTAHAWNSTRALQEKALLPILDEINDTLSKSGIDLETWHPESCHGQYEFVLPPLPPLEAVDTLLHARDIIATIAAAHSLRATLYPKPFPDQAGSAAHVHMSISSPHGEKKAVYESFYAGILHHLRSITAFTYSSPASYDRVADGCWAGGTWVTWGSQNRETALRKIHGSHWEIKCLDGLANVYLAMAAIIAAGTHGVLHKEKLRWDDCVKDPSHLSHDERKKLGIEKGLPRKLPEAIEALAEDEVLGGMLGKEVVERYIAVKRAEMKLLGTMSDEQRKGWIIDRY